MTPKELADIRQGAVLSNVLPQVELYAEGQKQRIVNEVKQRLADGQLTPDLAMYSWMEYISLDKMLRSLSAKVKLGVSAAEQNAEAMKIGATNG